MHATDVFVERVLTWSGADLALRFAVPEPPSQGERENWRCRYEILANADKTKNVQGEMVGVDGFQALELAIEAARIDVEQRFPGAFIGAPSYGPQFSYRLGQSLPYEYFLRLREHLEREAERKYEELVNEIIRLRRERKDEHH
jgi:hypothetical protein